MDIGLSSCTFPDLACWSRRAAAFRSLRTEYVADRDPVREVPCTDPVRTRLAPGR
jgi:hypothetical protein